MSAGVILAENLMHPPLSIGWSHHGAHLRHDLGGPPWWRYLNGVRVTVGRTSAWIELRKRTGRTFISDWRKK